MTYVQAAAAGSLTAQNRIHANAARRRKLDPQTLARHTGRLYRAAWFLCGSREEAEDLVQETFVRVLKRPRFLHAEDDVGYLLHVLRNTHASNRRSAARRPHTVALPDEPVALEDPSTARPDTRLAHVELHEAIAALPDIFKETVVAVDVVGLSYRQASRALGVREATITTRLHRARQRLADSLEPEAD